MQLSISRAVIAANRAAGLGGTPEWRGAQLQRNDRMGGEMHQSPYSCGHALQSGGRLEFAGPDGPEQNRQFFDLQRDLVGDIFGKIRILGKHQSNRLARNTARRPARWR